MIASPPPAKRWLVSLLENAGEPTPADEHGAYLAEARPVRSLTAGSRRRRLWELPQGTLCPLMGVCLPISTLRRVLGRTVGGAPGNDYDVHCAAINECVHRSAASEALQRELDARHGLALRRFARAKTSEAVAALWRDEGAGADPSGALWASLTHPRCGGALRERVCGDIHMLQHQLGSGHRADLKRLAALDAENVSLRRELEAMRDRHARALAARQRDLDDLAAEAVRLRAEGIRQDSLLQALQEASNASVPSEDEAHRASLERRTAGLERELSQARRRARSEGRRADELAARLAQLSVELAVPAPAIPATEVASPLRDSSVLCVGGRTASVPVYRRLTEVTGGRFAHHDGGEEQSVCQLEASLAAADLVICQTGCISHDAYWRVKDHCKRTGKRCVFVDNPSASSFARSLRAMPERA